jgi:hypothetical protein
MTLPTDPVTLSRLETLVANVTEFREDFARFAERSGERLSATELALQRLDTLIDLTRQDVATLKTRSDKTDDSQRSLSERTTALETAMTDITDLKHQVTGQIIRLIVTVIAGGGLLAYVLLKP